MALSTCPHCKKTLKVPDDSTPRALRCPLCKKIFEHTGAGGDGRSTLDGRRSAFAVALSKSEAPANGNGRGVANAAASSNGSGTSTILSDADEAMLREFGSGSGLLELTREAYTNGNPGDVNVQVTLPANAPRHATEVSPPPDQTAAPAPAMTGQPPVSPGQLPAGADMGGAEMERQFSVVSMALTMANKLVLAHKAELANVRSNQKMAWIVVGVLAAVFLATAFWGMDLRGDAKLAAKVVADMEQNAKASEAVNADFRLKLTSAETELSQTKAQLIADQGHNRTLTDNLRTAENRAAGLESDLKKAKTDATQAKARQDRAEADVADLYKVIDELNAELTAAKTATQPTAQPEPEMELD